MITNKRIPLSYPFQLIKWDLLFTILFSITIHFLTKYVFEIKIPIAIGAFLGTAIALILSFKLSQSYDRWWEARKVWGSIVNDSRTLVMQIKNFTLNKSSTPLIKQIGYRQIAWCYSLGQELRKIEAISIINPFISDNELENLRSKRSVSMHLLDTQLVDIRRLHKEEFINDFQHIQLDSTIMRLCASMGMSERIKNTNFPKPYRLTLHFFIYLFLIILSLSLTELESYISIPVLILISLPFFLLEKIALKMQDPFENEPTDTAVTTIARNIEINIKELLNDQDIPDPLKSNTFYSL